MACLVKGSSLSSWFNQREDSRVSLFVINLILRQTLLGKEVVENRQSRGKGKGKGCQIFVSFALLYGYLIAPPPSYLIHTHENAKP